jgi:hypothetical protein
MRRHSVDVKQTRAVNTPGCVRNFVLLLGSVTIHNELDARIHSSWPCGTMEGLG